LRHWGAEHGEDSKKRKHQAEAQLQGKVGKKMLSQVTEKKALFYKGVLGKPEHIQRQQER